ncbi:LuxR C-terminal-related transcriptional regulator, partial [Actinokineospora sp.]|uniref:LuxR C-terminal-related transcriptional regulator n=1 Tax=Actinokineospora sp. TaxID=1872133 RepID=UPI004037C279
FSDKLLLERDPFLLIEASIIAAYAVGAGRGYIYLRQEYPQARAVLAAALRRGGAPDPQRPGRLAAAALAALATGDLDAAIEWHREAVVAADAGGLPTQVGTASMAAAQVHLARGASVAAADSVTRAVDAFERAASPIPLGHARLLAGRVAAAREDVAASRRELALAKELFSAHGAHWLVVQATAGQCGLGARLPRHPTDHNGLSNRERDIAGLVSEGMSNRGIAEHLHLSVRTVECHVSRIFTKVGVTSRTALVRQIGNAQRV